MQPNPRLLKSWRKARTARVEGVTRVFSVSMTEMPGHRTAHDDARGVLDEPAAFEHLRDGHAEGDLKVGGVADAVARDGDEGGGLRAVEEDGARELDERAHADEQDVVVGLEGLRRLVFGPDSVRGCGGRKSPRSSAGCGCRGRSDFYRRRTAPPRRPAARCARRRPRALCAGFLSRGPSWLER